MDEQLRPETREENLPPENLPGTAPQAADSDQDFLGRDLEEFSRRFPGVDPLELEDDGMFRRFCGSRYGKESLAQLYADFVMITRTVWEAARKSMSDKQARSTGSGGSGGGDSGLTPMQRRELAEWNETNPHMKMSASEFRSR